MTDFLKDLLLLKPDEYIQICTNHIFQVVQTHYDEFNLTGITANSQYKETCVVLADEIIQSVASQYSCSSVNELSNACGCKGCVAQQRIIKIVNDLHKSNHRLNTTEYEYWTTFYSVISNVTSISDRTLGGAPKKYRILADSTGRNYHLWMFLKSLIKIYNEIIDPFATNEETHEVQNKMNGIEPEIIPYIFIKDFMDRYSNLIMDIVIVEQSYQYYDAIACNFKRWWKLDSDFKHMQKSIGIAFINGTGNFRKRKSDLDRSVMAEIMRQLVFDYLRTQRDPENTGAGEVGFTLACRLRIMSLIDVFRTFVSEEYIAGFLDPERLSSSKTYHIRDLTTKKIFRFLKVDSD